MSSDRSLALAIWICGMVLVVSVTLCLEHYRKQDAARRPERRPYSASCDAGDDLDEVL